MGKNWQRGMKICICSKIGIGCVKICILGFWSEYWHLEEKLAFGKKKMAFGLKICILGTIGILENLDLECFGG